VSISSCLDECLDLKKCVCATPGQYVGAIKADLLSGGSEVILLTCRDLSRRTGDNQTPMGKDNTSCIQWSTAKSGHGKIEEGSFAARPQSAAAKNGSARSWKGQRRQVGASIRMGCVETANSWSRCTQHAIRSLVVIL
jgi:hypothetical protein